MCTWEDISGCSGTSQEGIKYALVWDYQLKIEDSKMWYPHVVEAVQKQVFITVSTSKGIPYIFQQFQVVKESAQLLVILSVFRSLPLLGSMSINSLSLKKAERKVWNVDNATLNLQWFSHAPCSLKTVNLLLSELVSFETAANILFSVEAHTWSKVLLYVQYCRGRFFPFLFTNYLK